MTLTTSFPIDMSSIEYLNLWIRGWYGKAFSEKHNMFSIANFQLMILYNLGMKFFVLILMPCNLVCEWHYEIDVHSTNSNVNAKGGSKNLQHMQI